MSHFYQQLAMLVGHWRSSGYPSNFPAIIRRKDGKCLIVEIKDARFEAATHEDLNREGRGEVVITLEGRKAVALRKWQQLNPDHLKYERIFATGNSIARDRANTAYQFVTEP